LFEAEGLHESPDKPLFPVTAQEILGGLAAADNHFDPWVHGAKSRQRARSVQPSRQGNIQKNNVEPGASPKGLPVKVDRPTSLLAALNTAAHFRKAMA